MLKGKDTKLIYIFKTFYNSYKMTIISNKLHRQFYKNVDKIMFWFCESEFFFRLCDHHERMFGLVDEPSLFKIFKKGPEMNYCFS